VGSQVVGCIQLVRGTGLRSGGGLLWTL